MPESPLPTARTAIVSKGNRTRFPSLHLWEDPWEVGLDLRKLRAKKSLIDRVVLLLKQSGRAQYAPPGDRPQIEGLVSLLELDLDAGMRLVEDSLLILAWCGLREQRTDLQLGDAYAVKALAAAAQDARRLYGQLESNAVAIEEVIQALPGNGDNRLDSLDLLALSRQLALLVRAADIAAPLFGLTGSGRRPDGRRNVALALATEAVEEATGTRVEITRRGDSWRFANASGRYVRDVLGLLGWSDERVLVGAFDKLRREKRVKQ